MTGDRARPHLLAYTDARDLAGAEQSLAILLEHLPARVEVTVAGPDRRTLRHVSAGRPAARRVVTPDLATKRDLANGLTVRRVLSALRPSVIHLNKTEVGDLRYVEAVTRTMSGIRVVSVVHHVEEPAAGAAGLLARRLAVGAAAGATVAVADRPARQLENILRLPAGRVRTIPNALAALEQALPRPDRRFVIGSLARFVPHKAVDDLIAAVAAIEGARLLVGGDGPDRDRLERLAVRLGVAERVAFLGWVDPDDVLTNCDVVVSAARIEGHPMTLLDARRRGLPVVATDVGGVPDIVEDGVTGLLVAPGDVTGLTSAIKRLADDRTYRLAMGRAARSAAEAAGGPEAMASSYCDLYWPDLRCGDSRCDRPEPTAPNSSRRPRFPA